MSSDENQKLGKYTLIRKLAQGGMAEIFLANQEGPSGFQKQLVIKRILPHLADDAKFVEMFLDEARIAAQFNNANIVQIYDLGEVDGAYFIAMEFIDGHDLSQIIERAAHFGKRVPPPLAARMIADGLAALHYAHMFKDPGTGEELHLVHRDVSPQNLLVNKDGVVKLVDFGVAKAKTSSAKTQTGAVKGKFSYMAPEQIAGETLDGRCDVFAMGIVLYELLLGVRPFGEASDLMAITAIVHQPPKNPREIDESFPIELEKILNKALEKNRDNRYSDAEAMQRDLEFYLQRCGAFITSRELGKYLGQLFSDTAPDLESIGLGASSTHSFALDELKKSAESAIVPSGPTTQNTQPIGDPTPLADNSESEKSGGTSGLTVAILIVLVLVLGGGGFLVYSLFLSGDGDSGSSEAKAEKSDEEADATSAGSADEPDAGSAGGTTAAADASAPSDAASTAAAAGDATSPSASDVIAVAAAPDVSAGEPDAATMVGEPDAVVAKAVDMSNIVPEELPGTKASVTAGFGEVKLTANLTAVLHYRGQKINLPRTLNLPAGEHEIRLVSKDKKNPAEKRLIVTFFDGRHYELNVEFEKGQLNLETSPPGLQATINGKKAGKTPLRGVELYEGSHKVVLLVGKKKRSFSLNIVPGLNERTIKLPSQR